MTRTLHALATVLLVGFLGVFAPTPAQADTHQTVPSANFSFMSDLQNFLRVEDANRYADTTASVVVSGGLGATAGGLTHAPSALVAYPSGYYITETGSITYPDNSTCWVIAHKDTTANQGSFTRVSGTHYLLNCGSTPRPTLPSNSVWLMRVTTSGGAISSVVDYRTLVAHMYDLCQYNSLDEAISAIGSTSVSAFLACRLPVQSDQTVPSTFTITVLPGGQLDLESSLTDLTIHSRLIATPAPIFIGSGRGNVILSNTLALPQWWSAAGDGVTVDLTAIQYAYAASPIVLFHAGTYNLGTISGASASTLITIDGGGNHAGLYTQGAVKFICNTTVDEIHFLFKVINATSVSIGDVEFADAGYNPAITWHGAAGIFLSANNSTGPLRNIVVSSVRATGMVLPIFAGGGTPATTNRVHNVRIGLIDCTNCYYGWNGQNNGDNVVIDLIRTDLAWRSFFVYGCQGVSATVHSYNGRASTGDVDITAYASGYDTKNIAVDYQSRDANSGSLPITFSTIEASRVTTIAGVTINADIADTAVTRFARWSDYAASGAAENTGATNNVVTNVTLKGRLVSTGVSPTRFTASAQPTTTGMPLSLEGDFLSGGADSSVRPYFDLAQDYGNYAPTWTGASSNPVIGNGSLTGTFHRQGRLVTLFIDMTAGSTTTFGSGIWSFSLPALIPSTLERINPAALGAARFFDSGTNIRTGVATIGTNTVQVEADSATNAANSTTPFAWANGDTMQLQISYYLNFP